MTEPTRALVSPADLASVLDGPLAPVLLDIRWRLGGPSGHADFAAGHLPGAVFLDLDTDLSASPGDGGRHPLPEPADLQRVLRAAGVRTDRPVVAYDADNGMAAARAWWLLRWAGHDRVAVLDGGYAAWTAAGLPVSTDDPAPEPGDITVRPGGMPVLDADSAAALARTGVLLDARAPERYRGEVEPMDPRAGHIPGALNAPFAGNTAADGRWLSPAELTDRFAALGVPVPGGAADTAASAGDTDAGGQGARGAGDGGMGAGGQGARGAGDGGMGAGGLGVAGVRAGGIGAYCGSGVSAASVVLALEVAGVTRPGAPAALYTGSWSHWCVDPERPVATGAEPGA